MLDHCTHPDSGKDKNQSNMEILFEKPDVNEFPMWSLQHMARAGAEVWFPKYCNKNFILWLLTVLNIYPVSEDVRQNRYLLFLWEYSEVLRVLCYMLLPLSCSHGSLTDSNFHSFLCMFS